MDERTDEWMNGWMDVWMDGWMDVWMYKSINRCMHSYFDLGSQVGCTVAHLPALQEL